MKFGERCYWLPVGPSKAQRATQKMNKLADKWKEGHFLGIREVSGEALIGRDDTGAVVKARAIRRMPTAMRKSPETLLKIRGVPWRPSPNAEDREIKIAVDIERPAVEGDLPPVLPTTARKKEASSRKLYITESDIDRIR